MLQQNQKEEINRLFDRSIEEFYEKLKREELEAKQDMAKAMSGSGSNSGMDRD